MSANKTNPHLFRCGRHSWDFRERPAIMGILNVTPDSFSDGGRFDRLESGLQQARQMISEGADFIDIGGESTRPGAPEIKAAIEKQRVLPIIKALKSESDIPISIDTRKAEVAAAAIEAGADIVNDVSGLRHDKSMWNTLSRSEAGVIIMHMRGTPMNMQQLTDYDDLIGEIKAYFMESLAASEQHGIDKERIILDPGIGFSKTAEHNLDIIARLPEFFELGRPLLLGPSRKSFIGRILRREKPEERIWGTAGAAAAAVLRGAGIIRVHDVGAIRDAILVAAAVRERIHGENGD